MPSKLRDLEQVPPRLRRAIRACTDGSAPWPLFVHGPAGTGKSCGVLCLVDRVRYSKFWSEDDFNQTTIEAMLGRLVNSLGYETSPRELWETVDRAPLVVIDEIGLRATISDHQSKTLKKLLDVREQKTLVLVSNLPPDDIAKLYGDRIASRALSGTVVKIDGEDRRLKR